MGGEWLTHGVGGEGKVRLFSDNRSLLLIVRSLLLIVRSLLLIVRSLLLIVRSLLLIVRSLLLIVRSQYFSGEESVESATCFCLPYSRLCV